MKLDVSNMPINTLYRFDINKYVWSTMLSESRNGNNKQSAPIRYTEVYEITNEGYIKLLASGALVPNKNEYDYVKGFSIWDYDQEKRVDFKITIYLEELKLKDFYELHKAVEKNYNLRKR